MNVTQMDVIRRLGEVSRMLDAATAELAELDEAQVVARQSFEVAYADAFIRSEGPVEVRKSLATLATDGERFACEIAAARHRACRERINTLRNQLSTGQTVSAALRAQWSAEGVGQFT